MRPFSAEELEIYSFLSRYPEIEIGCYEVTTTQLVKGVVDANSSIRDALLRSGVHDFSSQNQGQTAKVLLPIEILGNGESLQSKIALYRPATKAGDARLWIREFRKLFRRVQPGDLIALFAMRRRLFAVNLSLLDFDMNFRCRFKEASEF